MPDERRHFTGAQKLAILREHLIEKVPISDVCQKHGIQPTLFYLWQKKLFEDGAVVFETKAANVRQSRRAGKDWEKKAILDFEQQYPLEGYRRLAFMMLDADVVAVSPSSVYRVRNQAWRIGTFNGSPQFVARDFKQFIRICRMTHVKTSPYYPQSNGKLERFHKTLKSECNRPQTPLNLDDARRVVERFVHHYNIVRLHSAIGYVTPADKLAGREAQIFAQRDQKLAEAREKRRQRRAAIEPTPVAVGS